MIFGANFTTNLKMIILIFSFRPKRVDLWLQAPHNVRVVNSARLGTEQRQQQERVLRLSLKPPIFQAGKVGFDFFSNPTFLIS